jgi:hypothetical protein
MSLVEMKVEVINKITSLNNESVLKEVLVLLKGANEKEKASFNLSRKLWSNKRAVW